jgi:hypothetical protein
LIRINSFELGAAKLPAPTKEPIVNQGASLPRLRLDHPDRVWVSLAFSVWAMALLAIALGSTLLI